jgi:hypothetical protein
MTTVQKLIKTFDSLHKNGNDYENLINTIMRDELERRLADEEFQIKSAVMYALEVSNHETEFKVKLAQKCYDMIKRSGNVK